MFRNHLLTVLLAASVPLFFGSGCMSIKATHTSETTAQKSTPKDQGPQQQEKGEIKDDARRDEVQRKLDIASRKKTKSMLKNEHSEVDRQIKLAKAEEELSLAQTRFQHFQEHTAPTRLQRAELSLQGSKDGVTEAEEELQQLELMYGEEDFADQTKEIVLERQKRRLQRSKRNLEIRQKELDFLKSFSLPLETREHELAVENAERKLKQTQRQVEATKLDLEIVIMNAEAEIAKREFQLKELEEELKEKKEE